MDIISNSLTKFLDERLLSIDKLDQFLDDLEDEVFGISNREFYLKYKGDIKEFIDNSDALLKGSGFEYELLTALTEYCRQRKITPD
ncbi:hypothetical protein [Prochlorococcus sp. MIT 1307]|uniref:hypothetical protein n=1 Tax=Prochlorococcus sp. MIT 1307 TaxID=3096219 RepID=UPI002A761939|nr:hypothetical protein [Prochlorococcus sp. MIT 1307]